VLFGVRGRFGRAQWWAIQIVVAVLTAILYSVANNVGIDGLLPRILQDGKLPDLEAGLGLLLGLGAAFAMLSWISFSATVKRFHDRDKSGYRSFLSAIPYIGAIWIIVECGLLPGTPGENRFDFGGRPAAADPSPVEPTLENRLPNLAPRAPTSRRQLNLIFGDDVQERKRGPTPPVFGRRVELR